MKVLEEAAEILEDIADVADMRGRASEKRMGAIYIRPEQGTHMREIASSLRYLAKKENEEKEYPQPATS